MLARIRGTEIYFDVEGPQLLAAGDELIERPVLFVLHGGPGGDHASFRALAPLRDVCQVVYIDHRGCGRSGPCDPATWTLEENVADVDALRDHLGLERIAVLGGSYGGMVAQGYAIRHADRVSNLLLVATAPSYRFIEDARRNVRERGTPQQQAACQRLFDGAFESLDQLYEFYRLMAPWYSTTYAAEKFEKSWRISRRNFEALNRGFGGFLRTFDFTPDLHRITCPTLVLAGAHDWICPAEHSRTIAERIPRAHLKVFPHAAHSIGSDEPEAFLAAVRGFLTHAPL